MLLSFCYCIRLYTAYHLFLLKVYSVCIVPDRRVRIKRMILGERDAILKKKGMVVKWIILFIKTRKNCD